MRNPSLVEAAEMEQKADAPFKRWVETARHLGQRSPGAVACPCCGSASLSVMDVEYGFGHERGIQRYITCGWCGAFNGVNVRRAGKRDEAALQAAE
jgi:hypothetical protein